ncbi:MAG: carbohydrate ABC transporter permease, partial [Clostridia bacterium]
LQGSALNRTMQTVRSASGGMENLESLNTLTKYCAIVVSTLPIIAVYPFLQKYFIKGVMIGAVKG